MTHAVNNRSSIITICVVLLIGAWYGGAWAYTSLYKKPRAALSKRIEDASRQIEQGTRTLQTMRRTITADAPYYVRSLPRQPTSARSLYQFWLLELLQFCEFSQQAVESAEPVRVVALRHFSYRFQVRGRGSLDQVARFLYEFYWAAPLHRIATMNIVPVENSELLDMSLTIEAIAIPPQRTTDPAPALDRLPTGYLKRTASDHFASYGLIAERNLLRRARGGVDRADYTYLTSIQEIDGSTSIWLTDRTTESIVKAEIGARVEIGSFRGTLLSVLDRDVVFERGGMLWLLAVGDCLNTAYALPPETQP